MNKVRQIREIKGLTQEELAKMARIGRKTLCNIEGNKSNTTQLIYSKIAKALNCDIKDLID